MNNDSRFKLPPKKFKVVVRRSSYITYEIEDSRAEEAHYTALDQAVEDYGGNADYEITHMEVA